MKGRITISMLFSLLLIGCGTGNKQSTEDLITVDVTANYPEKELILQDFMDVEYVPLETTNEFITNGKVMDVGKDIILVSNVRDGDILVYDRATGQGVRKINRKGQGAEEYLMPMNVILNEANDEMFANDGPSSKIQVYDLEGNFKRSIPYKKDALVSYLYDYNNDYLLCQETYAPGVPGSPNSFFLLSKQDGSIKDIEIPYEKRLSVWLIKQEGNMAYSAGPKNSFIVPSQNNWILMEPSADTVYMNLPDGSMQPFMVRTPSVQTMTPEVFLFPGVVSDPYYFMQTVKKEYDFEKEEGLTTTNLMYDKEENKIYQYTVHNSDFNERKEDMSLRSLNNEIAFCAKLEAVDLVEAYGKGKLNGKLKEIAAGLDEESNPVIMVVKYKK